MRWHVDGMPLLNLDDLGLEQDAHLLIRRAPAEIPSGQQLGVIGRHPALAVQLAACGRPGRPASQ